MTCFLCGARHVVPLVEAKCFSVNGPRSLGAKALLLWLRLRNDRRRHRLFLQRMFENFVQRMHVRNFDVAENLWREIRHDIGLIVRRQQNFLDSGPLCAEHLFLYAADGQNHTRECHFAGHCQPVLHRTPLSKLTSAVTMAAPADGPSFGTAPDGTWM